MTFDEAKLVQTQTAAIRRTDTVFGDNTDNLGDMEGHGAQEMPEDMEEDFKDEDMDSEGVKQWLAVCAETEALSQELTEQLR